MQARRLTRKEKKALRDQQLQFNDHVRELKEACPDHPVPITRRDFFERGLLTGISYVTLPSFLSELLRTSPAMAETVADFPAIIQLHCSGGASLSGNAMGYMAGGAPLPPNLITRFGVVGNTMSLAGSTAIPFGAPETGPGFTFLTRNRIIEGLLGTTAASQTSVGGGALTAAEIGQVQMAGILTKSADDGGAPNNLIMVGGAAALVGRKGASGVDVVNNIGSGVNTTGVSSALSAAGPRPISALNVADFAAKVRFSPQGLPANVRNNAATLTAVAKVMRDISMSDMSTSMSPDRDKLMAAADKAYTNNLNLVANPPVVDVTADTRLAPIFAAGNAATAQNPIYGSMVKSVLEGTVGSAEFQIGGCDYHAGGTRANADAKDLEIGGRMRQAVKAALAVGKKTVIVVCTNGNNIGNAGNPEGAWNADQGGVHSMYYMMVVTPTGQAKPRQKSAQLGAFLPNGSTDPNSPVGTAQNAARAILVNVLLLAGKSATAVANALSISAMQVEELRLFG